MRLRVLAAVTAMLAMAFAAPTSHAPKHAFSVKQRESGRKILRNGPAQVAKAYLKYNGTVPTHISRAADRVALAAAAAAVMTGSVAANPSSYDSEYLCPVSIGTPAQSLNLDFDTGSSDLWAFSSELPASDLTGRLYYSPSKSTTASQESGETWKISYGDKSGASGNVFADTVNIGGASVTSQAVEAATSISSQFASNTNNDGLVGLAFENLNTCSPSKCQTFMGNIANSLAAPLFTASLKYHAAGSYDFGYIDSSKYTGTITYLDISTSKGWWEFTATGYQVGSKSYTASLDCIADTGTSLIYMPDAVVANYYAQVAGAKVSSSDGGYIFPCSATLPSVSFLIAGKSFTVPGTYLNYAPTGDGTNCFGGLQSVTGLGAPVNILGDVFLKSQFVVFEFGKQQIGFATPA